MVSSDVKGQGPFPLEHLATLVAAKLFEVQVDRVDMVPELGLVGSHKGAVWAGEELPALHLSRVLEHQVRAHALCVLGGVGAPWALVPSALVLASGVRRHLLHGVVGQLANAAHPGHPFTGRAVADYQCPAHFDGFVWINPAIEEIQINPSVPLLLLKVLAL